MKNDYILIIGQVPYQTNEKDGMVQRELAIDNLICDYKRIYIENIVPDFYFLKFPKKYFKNKVYNYKNKLKQLKTNKVKLLPYINKKRLFELCKNAKMIYIHSIYSINKLNQDNILTKCKDKIIIDIHGCAVEELGLYNIDQSMINKFQQIEAEYFNSVNTLIAVTQNMIDFYKRKYPDIKTNFILLPIFNKNNYRKESSNKKLNIIYSGGTQKWQNIDLMIQAIKSLHSSYEITICTPDVEIFKQELREHIETITIKNVPSNELYKEYQRADLGFVLRDNIDVNRVACPTKLIDYIQFGIIPIIKHPEIGDFEDLGYKYISLDDILHKKLPDKEQLKYMRENNYKVIEKLNNQHYYGIESLKNLLKRS